MNNNESGFRINLPPEPEIAQEATPRDAEKMVLRLHVEQLSPEDTAILVLLHGGEITVQSYGTDDDTKLLGVYALGRVIIDAGLQKRYQP